MAKKSRSRERTPRKRQQRPEAERRRGRRRRGLLLGGLLLVLVVGIGLAVRYVQQRNLPIRLQGAIDNHYTLGPPGATVVVKEFSDYT
jgi:uncharacterized protein HemX